MTGAYQRCNLFVLWSLVILYRGRENLPAGNSVSWSTGWAQSTERGLTSGNNNDRIERGIVKNIPWSWAWVIYASGGQVVCRSIYRPTSISINKNEDKNGIKRKRIKKKWICSICMVPNESASDRCYLTLSRTIGDQAAPRVNIAGLRAI